MKRMVVMATLATLLAAAWPAGAQPGPGQGGRRGMDRPMPQRPMGPPPERGWQRHDGEGMQRRGQLSPEEREKLRQDIGQHGRDIYRDPRRGGPGKQ
jgi:Spy/CpxP family protein refolding chaperone